LIPTVQKLLTLPNLTKELRKLNFHWNFTVKYYLVKFLLWTRLFFDCKKVLFLLKKNHYLFLFIKIVHFHCHLHHFLLIFYHLFVFQSTFLCDSGFINCSLDHIMILIFIRVQYILKFRFLLSRCDCIGHPPLPSIYNNFFNYTMGGEDHCPFLSTIWQDFP